MLLVVGVAFCSSRFELVKLLRAKFLWKQIRSVLFCMFLSLSAAHVPFRLVLVLVQALQPSDNTALAKRRARFGAVSSSVGISAEAGGQSELAKKAARDDRFGTPALLNDESKKSLRAKRFGGGDVDPSSASSGLPSEESKNASRAARFGSATSSAPADDDTKKALRAKRFADRGAKIVAPSSSSSASLSTSSPASVAASADDDL